MATQQQKQRELPTRRQATATVEAPSGAERGSARNPAIDQQEMDRIDRELQAIAEVAAIAEASDTASAATTPVASGHAPTAGEQRAHRVISNEELVRSNVQRDGE